VEDTCTSVVYNVHLYSIQYIYGERETDRQADRQNGNLSNTFELYPILKPVQTQ